MSTWLPGGAAAPERRRRPAWPGFPPGGAAVVNATPDLALAALFLVTWMRPAAVSGDMVARLTVLMALEFVVVHSAGFMGFVVHGDGTRTRRTLWMLLLIGVYSLFAAGFSLAAHGWWPLVSFLVLGLNRTATIWTGHSRGMSVGEWIVRGWVVPTLLYLGSAIATAAAPIPRLGITDAIVAADRHPGVGGQWIDEPWRALAFGTCYFAVLGLVELFDPGGAGAPSGVEA